MEGKLTGYLGLGSNEGDRLANLRAARDALARRGVEPVRSSSVYETAPQGEVTDQPDFLNACLRICTELDPGLRLPDGTPLQDLLPNILDQRVTPHAGGSWRS